MHQLTGIVSDRGSKYAVSGGPAASREDVDAFLKELKQAKKFAKATHNTWAVLLPDGTPLKGDDGEAEPRRRRPLAGYRPATGPPMYCGSPWRISWPASTL